MQLRCEARRGRVAVDVQQVLVRAVGRKLVDGLLGRSSAHLSLHGRVPAPFNLGELGRVAVVIHARVDLARVGGRELIRALARIELPQRP